MGNSTESIFKVVQEQTLLEILQRSS